MINVLVLGASGLIGSTIFKYLSSKKKLFVTGTYNTNKLLMPNMKKFNFLKDDVSFFDHFNLVINCIGITKHNTKANDLDLMYNLNIKLPLLLSDYEKKKKFNIIHISTDCVFSGLKGNYKENSIDFSTDNYGQTKRIAEIIMKNSLVIRTSTIGHEFFHKNGLLEWFLSTKKKCIGFDNAYFNGLTTLELAKIIYSHFINNSYYPKSLINIGSTKISKFDLLCEIKKIYKQNVEIERDFKFKIDRSLNINKFLNLTEYKPKTWYKMIKENKIFFDYV